MNNINVSIKTTLAPHISSKINSEVKSTTTEKLFGLIGRGVKTVYINADNELMFVMTDGSEINVGTISGGGVLPVASTDTLGGIKVGENLKIADGVLSVDTATEVQRDNTKPITSGAVHTEIGNIEVLLEKI